MFPECVFMHVFVTIKVTNSCYAITGITPTNIQGFNFKIDSAIFFLYVSHFTKLLQIWAAK